MMHESASATYVAGALVARRDKVLLGRYVNGIVASRERDVAEACGMVTGRPDADPPLAACKPHPDDGGRRHHD